MEGMERENDLARELIDRLNEQADKDKSYFDLKSSNISKIYDMTIGSEADMYAARAKYYEFVDNAELAQSEKIKAKYEKEKEAFVDSRVKMMLMNDEAYRRASAEEQKFAVAGAVSKASGEYEEKFGGKKEAELEAANASAKMANVPEFLKPENYKGGAKEGKDLVEGIGDLSKLFSPEALAASVSLGFYMAISKILELFDQLRKASSGVAIEMANMYGTAGVSAQGMVDQFSQGVTITEAMNKSFRDAGATLTGLSIGTRPFIDNFNELARTSGAAFARVYDIKDADQFIDKMASMTFRISALGQAFEGSTKEGTKFATEAITYFSKGIDNNIASMDKLPAIYSAVFDYSRQLGMGFDQFYSAIDSKKDVLSSYNYSLEKIVQTTGSFVNALDRQGYSISQNKEFMTSYVSLFTQDFNKMLGEAVFATGNLTTATADMFKGITSGTSFENRVQTLSQVGDKLGLFSGKADDYDAKLKDVMFLSQQYGISATAAVKFYDEFKTVFTGKGTEDQLQKLTDTSKTYDDLGLRLMQDQLSTIDIIKNILEHGLTSLVTYIAKMAGVGEIQADAAVRGLAGDNMKGELYQMYLQHYGTAHQKSGLGK